MVSPSTGPEPVLRHPWRFAIVAVVLLVVANLVFFVLSESETTREEDRQPLPVGVESVSPQPGEILQDEIVADLQNTYTGVLLIDGVEVPEDQLTRVEDLGQVGFRPGPDKDVERFEPGVHTVTVLFWVQGRDRPSDPGVFSWDFRAVS